MRYLHIILFLIPSLAFTQVTDNFDSYSNGATLASQANWSAMVGNVYVNKPASDGAFYGGTTDGFSAAIYDGTFSDDQYAQIYYQAGVSGNARGPVVRGTSGGDGYCFYSTLSTSYLDRVDNGTATSLATGAAWTTGRTYRLEIEGTELRVYENGSLFTSISGDGVLTDGTYASGNPGVACWATSTSSLGDDFEGGNLTETYSPTQYQPKYNGVSYIPKYNGVTCDMKTSVSTPPEDPEGFTILEYWDFEDQTAGQFTEAEIESYFSGASAYIDAGHEDKLNIVTESLNGNASNKALQLTYPASTYSQLYFWDYPLNGGAGYDTVYISMTIKYGKDDMTGWSSTNGGKNFGIKSYPTGDLMSEPASDEGYYVVPTFSSASTLIHYYYNHWDNGYGGNYNYPSYGTNTNHFTQGVWFKLTIRAVMNTNAASYNGIMEIIYNSIPIYQYDNYRYFEDASLMGNKIDLIEFTHFFGGASDEYRMDETAYVYWDDIVIWKPATPVDGLTVGTLDVPYPVTGETFPYTTLITTEQTFTNSEYGGNYSAQQTEAWLIDAGAGNTVTLEIDAMDLDNDALVQKDAVRIYDGNTPGSTLIGRHASALTSNFPAVDTPITSTGRYMYVIFESDRNGQVGTGFQMTITFN